MSFSRVPRMVWLALAMAVIFAVGIDLKQAGQLTFGATPAALTVRAIWTNGDRMEGRLVETTGTVEAFRDPGGKTYYALEDQAHRIGLQGDPTLAIDVGHHVDVVGTVHFKPDVGIFVETQRVTPE